MRGYVESLTTQLIPASAGTQRTSYSHRRWRSECCLPSRIITPDRTCTAFRQRITPQACAQNPASPNRKTNLSTCFGSPFMRGSKSLCCDARTPLQTGQNAPMLVVQYWSDGGAYRCSKSMSLPYNTRHGPRRGGWQLVERKALNTEEPSDLTIPQTVPVVPSGPAQTTQ